LSNKDPERHYVLVDPNNKIGYGVQNYEARGYRTEIRTQDGVYFTRGGMRQEGSDVLMCMDLVLMSCSAEDKEERRQAGLAKTDRRDAAQTRGIGKGFNQVSGMYDLPRRERGLSTIDISDEDWRAKERPQRVEPNRAQR